MKTNYLKVALAGATASVMLASCGGSKEVANRTKRAKTECQAKALEANISAYRAWGWGTDKSNESFATNIAELDARTKIVRQLETQLTGLITNYNKQYSSDEQNTNNLASGQAAQMGRVGKAQELQTGLVDKALRNTRAICTEAYDRKDGTIEVYVCVELSDEQATEVVRKVADAVKMDIDFAEHQFRQEMSKAKDDFRQQQNK